MSANTLSVNGVPIRLPEERWAHIIEEHGELQGLREQVMHVLSVPERVLAGNGGENLAVGQIDPGKWLVVVYREYETDGFVITAFTTRRASFLDRRQQLWP